MSFVTLGSGCPYSTPLRLGLFRFPGPCSLGLAGGAMAARRWWDTVEVGRE